MPQLDAGPGDWSDREWESPEKKQQPQAKRRFALPPWALMAVLVAVVIGLCVGLVFVVKAIQRRDAKATPTGVPPEASAGIEATPTYSLETPGTVITPTATAELPISPTTQPTAFTEIAPGATVVVTASPSLSLRAAPGTNATVLEQLPNGMALTVLEGPQVASGLTWWRVRRADGTGKEGWVAEKFLKLK